MSHEFTEEQLEQKLAEAGKRIEVGALYGHYKDRSQTYRVLMLAIMRYTLEPCVIYEAQYGKRLTYMRTIPEWFLPATLDGKQVERFQKI